jgi:DNA-3-methyladenine glycosylase
VPPGRHFDRSLLAAPTLEAARAVLGAWLVRDPVGGSAAGPRVGRIVEVEAYIGRDDRASHARMGPTPRNGVMFGPPGIAYVYLVYGMHHCLNIVTEDAPTPAALLVRAVEPVAGTLAMRHARGLDRAHARSVPDHRLASGPGLVGAAFSVDRSMSGLDLCDPLSALRLEARPAADPKPELETGPRVGIAYAGEPWASLPWRLWIAGNSSVSRVARR